MFLDHTQRRTTVGRTPLDKWSARRRDLYLATHDTHNRQISMPPVGFEPTISAGERPWLVSILCWHSFGPYTKRLYALSCGNHIFLFCKESLVRNLCALFFLHRIMDSCLLKGPWPCSRHDFVIVFNSFSFNQLLFRARPYAWRSFQLFVVLHHQRSMPLKKCTWVYLEDLQDFLYLEWNFLHLCLCERCCLWNLCTFGGSSLIHCL